MTVKTKIYLKLIFTTPTDICTYFGEFTVISVKSHCAKKLKTLIDYSVHNLAVIHNLCYLFIVICYLQKVKVFYNAKVQENK